MRKKEFFIPLIGKKNKIIGFEKKEKIHTIGLLHSAVSVFVFNSKKKNQKMLMLQKRSSQKYHSSLLWTNTCCSHPRKNESILTAAHRCLIEEMGFDCFLEKKFCFTYRELLNNGLIENELDHVFVGYYSYSPIINYKEVDNWKWITLNKLIEDIHISPESYTIWFKIIIKKYLKQLDFN
ncbi:MAG: NUDIX domain-containing protein [Flavobacteriales bacterium]|jgi:isopentenyl-diphosphate delta-isomerase|uniref:isopentenyl-diphosphate Delta-isomerase n=1 Tax=Blattabacterium sp. (Mastotermes darwiniensis) TaxID=39768 RepID=UPI000231DE9F|nr:NUDIX domain-containing protein [Blattabacterium sp. (Mastotermes darwiniensis)]AER40723.1 putative isopentenyl-diphosphate delta-isomerase [Blattabacterium sp. (Mastotermes darwiniensis) str. MADAR]MDR1804749.1 NUDIX domain-containing protein [Flavobacteriales bacterium]